MKRIFIISVTQLILATGVSGCYTSASSSKDQNASKNDPKGDTAFASEKRTENETETNTEVITDISTGDNDMIPNDTNVEETEHIPQTVPTVPTDWSDGNNSSDQSDQSEQSDTIVYINTDTDTSIDTGTDTDTAKEINTDTQTEIIADGGTGCMEGNFYILTEDHASEFSELTCIIGELRIGASQLEDIHFPNLTSIVGDLVITENSTTKSVSLENLTSVSLINIVNNDHLDVNLSGVTSAKEVQINGNGFSAEEGYLSVDLSSLKETDIISMGGNRGEVLIGFDSLELVEQTLNVSGNSGFDVLDFSSLLVTHGAISMSGLGNATRIDLSNLTISGNISMAGNALLEEILLGSLETIEGYITMAGNGTLQTIDLSSLETTVGGGIDVTGNRALTTIHFDSLQNVGGELYFKNNASLSCDADLIANQITATEIQICGNAPDTGCGPDECPTD